MKATGSFMVLSALTLSSMAFGAIRTNTIVNGASDWTDPLNFNDTSFAPGGSEDYQDVVIIPPNSTVRLNASTDPGSLARVRNLRQILLGSTASRFEINVEGDDEVDIPVSISGYKYVPYIDYQCGPVVKIGTGTLSLSSVGFHELTAAYDYYTTMTASQGVFKIQQNLSPLKSTSLGRITIEEGATLFLPYSPLSGGSVYVKSLAGGGVITNDVSVGSVVNDLYIAGLASYNDYATFSGELNATLNRIFIRDSSVQSLTGDSSKYVGETWLTMGNYNSQYPKIGVHSFGTGNGSFSSLGKMNGASSPLFQFDIYGGEVEFLGEGGSSARGFVFRAPTTTPVYPAVVNGGAHGGIEFTQLWQRLYTSSGGQNLVLTGSNTAACVLKNSISDNTASSADAGKGHTLYIRKEGTGIWRIEDHIGRNNLASGISVDEGVLQYTTLAETGEACALGMATNLTDGTMGTVDTNKEHRVQYAVRLGGETMSGESKTSGRLEFAGSADGATTTRKIAVAGVGGLRNNGESQVVYGGGVYGISSDDMTLYLDGTGTGENVVNGISDGTAGGSLSVVKEGPGNWFLDGSLTFTGDISVKGGTLTIRQPVKYSWYRWTVTSLYPASAGTPPYSSWKNGTDVGTRTMFHEIGLFDSAGSNLVAGIDVDPNATVGSKYACLKKGAAQVQPIGGATVVINKQSSITVGDVTSNNVPLILDRAFDCAYSGWSTWGTSIDLKINNAARRPVQDDETTWCPIVMRLRDDLSEVAGFDFANVYGGWTPAWNSCISNFMIEASLDGVHWDSITNVEGAALHYDGGMWSCQGGYKDGEETHSGSQRLTDSFPNSNPHYKSYPIKGRPDSLPVVTIPNGTVSVSGGGVLKFEGDGAEPIVLSDVQLDAKSGGTIEGFALAARGTLSVLNAETMGRTDLPATFVDTTGVANLAGWDLSLGGRVTSRFRIVVTGNSVSLVPVGTVMVLR